ncbi:MAG: recombinase family protein [Oscillospiraceae bacterium]
MYKTARYARLSREDGDKPESDSILNQLRVITDFCSLHPELEVLEDYTDDGFTGTNFQRPGFQRMLGDIQAGTINCVVVKDLSRFGRDYIDMGYYLERLFPTLGVRFIAVNDRVDSLSGPYDILLPLKNIFNTQYAKDISSKIRSSFRTKQRRGEFVGAFASYGYLKDPENRNHLIPDPVAAEVVQRIFQMAASGIGQIRIAKQLNEELVPCPSEYKRLMGERYSNGQRLETTCYWTYATIHRILKNETYLGNMVANRYERPAMHGKAKKAAPSDWIVVDGTHEPIISRELWDTVQAQIAQNARPVDFTGHVSLFAGFLFCGDCGRAMCKTSRNGLVSYTCGSYHRYGASVCSSHYIRQDALESILLSDLNRIIGAVPDLEKRADEFCRSASTGANSAQSRLRHALERIRRLKQSAYEDYKDGMLGREDYLRYKADYDRQEELLCRQISQAQVPDTGEIPVTSWAEELAAGGKLANLDRATLAQTVKSIRVFEDRRIEITYLFSENLRALLE